ncbi:MAG: hypothetical protein ACYDEX_23660 [Mobilitalea sp.]
MKLHDRKPKSPVPTPNIPTIDFQKMHVAFCFKDIDKNQGATLENWHQQNLLLKMVQTISDISHQRIYEAIQNQSIKAYHDFPNPSNFTHPPHVIEDADWAAIHITGKQVIGGHVERNIFHVVFLDSEHGFAVSQKFKDKKVKKSQR